MLIVNFIGFVGQLIILVKCYHDYHQQLNEFTKGTEQIIIWKLSEKNSNSMKLFSWWNSFVNETLNLINYMGEAKNCIMNSPWPPPCNYLYYWSLKSERFSFTFMIRKFQNFLFRSHENRALILSIIWLGDCSRIHDKLESLMDKH